MPDRDPLRIKEIGTSTTFLTGEALSEAARKIAGGQDLRCAVAFWGRGAEAFLRSAGAEPSHARIVCDLSMGGCSPTALVELGAPDNLLLRHRPGLHAKVYISERGALIGSANASDNGLGFAPQGARLTEAATLHEVGSETWRAAAEWFERLHDEALPLDGQALEAARPRWSPTALATCRLPTLGGSLLDLVLANHERFAGVGFVVVSEESTERSRTRARRAAIKAGVADKSMIEELPGEGMFVGWDRKDVLRWPVSFFEFWIPTRSLRIFPRTVRALDPGNGTVFSKRDARSVARLLPEGFVDLHEAQRLDAARVKLLRDRGEGLFPTALQLARALETV